MAEQKIPEHLEGLNSIKDRIYPTEPDAEEYAEVAFSLAKIEQGDKEALARVTRYIQNRYTREKLAHEKFVELKRSIASWIAWAENWTAKKTDSL